MSARPKSPDKRGLVSHGSLYAPCIDFKPGVRLSNAQSADVGVRLVENKREDARFRIKFYYGPVEKDPIGVYIPTNRGLHCLLFKIEHVLDKPDRRAIANMIEQRVYPVLKTGMYDITPYSDDKSVCSDSHASYYVLAFFVKTPVLNYEPDFPAIARAIAIADTQTAFKIGNDGHEYSYSITTTNVAEYIEQGATARTYTAEMEIVRKL
jgi:hypothetical protein